MNISRLVPLICLSALLSGCLGWNKATIKDVGFSSTSAKDRVLYSKKVEATDIGAIKTDRVVCLEPSPDVAVASQSALELVAKAADGTKAQLSSSTAEALANLVERTATIQLLRDQMFRACESYSNGAISATSYSLIMSRNNKAMITLMLGETAAGAFGRKGVVLGGKSSAEGSLRTDGSSDTFEESLARLTKIDSDLVTAKEEQTRAQTALDNANEVKEGETAPTVEEKASLAKALETAKTNVKKLENEKANALVLVQSTHNQTSKSAAEIVDSEGFGALSSSVTDTAIEALAQMQEIYMRGSIADEVISACVVEMGFDVGKKPNPVELNPPILNSLNATLSNFTGMIDKSNISTTEEDIQKTISNAIAYVAKQYKGARRSALTEFCDENLPGLVNRAEENRQQNVFRYYDLKMHTIKYKAYLVCDKIKDVSAKKTCLDKLGIEFPEEKEPKNLGYFADYNVLKTLEVEVEEIQKDLKSKYEELKKKVPAITNAAKPHCAPGEQDEAKKVLCELLDRSLSSVITGKIAMVKSGRKEFPVVAQLDSAFYDKIGAYFKAYQEAINKGAGKLKDEELPHYDKAHSEIGFELNFHKEQLSKLVDEFKKLQSELAEKLKS